MAKNLVERIKNSEGRNVEITLKPQYKFIEIDGGMTVLKDREDCSSLESFRLAVGCIRSVNAETFQVRPYYHTGFGQCEVPYEAVESFKTLR
jgi:hypothetical protein